MRILLTNDDGIYAPGLAAMQRELRRLGEVYVVAPATEQSGVGHSITYLTPLIVKEVFYDERYPGQEGQRWGWAVQGSPADCVKIGIAEFCPEPPRSGRQRHQQRPERRHQRAVFGHGGGRH